MKMFHIEGDVVVNGDPIHGHTAVCQLKRVVAVFAEEFKQDALREKRRGGADVALTRLKHHALIMRNCVGSDVDVNEARLHWKKVSMASTKVFTTAK